MRVLNGVLAYHPLERLDVNTSYTNTLRQVNQVDDVRSSVLQALVSARLLDTLRADLTLERSTQDDFTNLREIEHWVAGATLVAKLMPHLELTLGYHDDQADVSGPGAGLVPDPSEKRTQMIWLFRPSEQLTAQIEIDWLENYANSGIDQRSRIDWIPFERGSLDVQLDLDRIEAGSTTQSQIDRMRAQARYTITPRAFLELSFSMQDPSDAERTELVTLMFNFSS